MSLTNARIRRQAAPTDSQKAWLGLLAPDRRPRLQPNGHAAVAGPPRLRLRLNKVLLSMLSER